jgi:hypothetical protein
VAIQTFAQARSGLRVPYPISKGGAGLNTVGRWGTLWAAAGTFPGAGAYDGTLNGVSLTAPVTGSIPWTDPASGVPYLGRLECVSTRTDIPIPWMPLLADRLWHNGNIDETSLVAQNIVTPAWPARDENGSANGAGVYIAYEVSVQMGAATPTMTLSYTNSAGVAGRTATNVQVTVSAIGAGNMGFFSLQAGDVGVRSVESITFSASWISGTMHLVAYRPILFCNDLRPMERANYDVVTSGMPRLYNGSVLYFMGQAMSTSVFSGFGGIFQPTWG